MMIGKFSNLALILVLGFVYCGGNTAQPQSTNWVEKASVSNDLFAPTNLTVTFSCPTALDLSWDNGSTSATHFEIERKSDGGSFEFVAEVKVGSTTFYSDPIASSMTYTYRIQGVIKNNAEDIEYVSHYSDEAQGIADSTLCDDF